MPGDFLTNYFIAPIIYAQGYNSINTSVYAVTFVIAAYLIFKLLKKINVKIDRKLVLAITPFVVIGSLFRVLYDAGFVTSQLFVSPSIYFVVFAITIIILFVSLFIQKRFKIGYHKTMFVTGLMIAAVTVGLFEVRNAAGAAIDIGIFLPIVIVLYFAKWGIENKIVLSLQMFDATTTFTSLQFFNYREQHVLPNVFINALGLGPISFIPLKAIAVVIVLILIDKYSDDKQFANYLKILIGILGAATSLRDFTRLVALV